MDRKPVQPIPDHLPIDGHEHAPGQFCNGCYELSLAQAFGRGAATGSIGRASLEDRRRELDPKKAVLELVKSTNELESLTREGKLHSFEEAFADTTIETRTVEFLAEAFGDVTNLPMTANKFLEDIRRLTVANDVVVREFLVATEQWMDERPDDEQGTTKEFRAFEKVQERYDKAKATLAELLGN